MRSATMEGRVLPLPRVVGAPEGANSYFAIQDGYYITKSSTQPQMAWNWITFIVQHLDASLTQIPPLKSLIASEEYALRAAPDVLALARSLPDDMFFLNLDYLSEPKLNEVSNIFQRAVMKIVEEKADVQTTLDEAQKEAEEVMASSEE